MGEGLDRCFPSGKLPRWGETGGSDVQGFPRERSGGGRSVSAGLRVNCSRGDGVEFVLFTFL